MIWFDLREDELYTNKHTHTYNIYMTGDKPYLVGENVTFVDFILFEMLVSDSHD
jgi:hypothetical protein